MNLFWNNHAFGIDGRGIQGSGGAMSITGRSGVVMNNTIVSNTGSPVCSGDGISLGTYNSASVQWSICNNILVNNGITGLSCASYSDHTTVGNNLFFEQPNEFGCDPYACPKWMQEDAIYADPVFCDPVNGDFSVASTSPALGEFGPIGAFPIPGCASTPVVPTTWGGIKLRFK
jgi:hypothetical protein